MVKYFVFDRCYNKNNSLWVVCYPKSRLLTEAKPFKLINLEEVEIGERQERALQFLVRRKIKEVWSYRAENASKDSLLGLKLHQIEIKNKSPFHYNFIDPAIYGEVFSSRGIELKEFMGKQQSKDDGYFTME